MVCTLGYRLSLPIDRMNQLYLSLLSLVARLDDDDDDGNGADGDDDDGTNSDGGGAVDEEDGDVTKPVKRTRPPSTTRT